MTMTTEAPHPNPLPRGQQQSVELRCFTYEDRRGILTALFAALSRCGCWMQDQQARTSSQMEFRFEVHLSAVDELYSSLIAAGVEVTRDSHLAMTWLCTLRRYSTEVTGAAGVRMEMSFLEDMEREMGTVAMGCA